MKNASGRMAGGVCRLIGRVFQSVFVDQFLRLIGRGDKDFVVDHQCGQADGVLFTGGGMCIRRIADFQKRPQRRDAGRDVDNGVFDVILAKNLFDRSAAPSVRVAVQDYFMHKRLLISGFIITVSIIIVYLDESVKRAPRGPLCRMAVMAQTPSV